MTTSTGQPADTMQTPQAEQPLILIIDDDWVNRELTETVLQRGHFRGIGVGSGKAAFDLLDAPDSELPAAVLLDMHLPDMTGLEVCEHIRNQPRTSHLPIFIVTALETKDVRQQATDAGADGFIAKQKLVRELVPALRTRLNC